MDGYQATAKLREDARFGQLPIIAMTAHATLEERQRCLAAGMNDHISKPIDPGALFETVGRFYTSADGNTPAETGTDSTIVERARQDLTQTPAVPSQAKPTETPPPLEQSLPTIDGLDTKDGLNRVAGNSKLYLKLLKQFIEQQGTAPEQIGAALSSKETALAERLAHTLKGVAGNIGAKKVQSVAGTLEKLIREKAAHTELAEARRQVAVVLEPFVGQLRNALSAGTPEPADSSPTPPADPAQSRAAATELVRLLSLFDPGAIEFLEANQTQLKALLKPEEWVKLEGLIQNYGFSEAQAQVEQVLENRPST